MPCGARRLAPILLYLCLAIVNTAIEPWPGQGRYRMHLQPFLFVALIEAGAAVKQPRT